MRSRNRWHSFASAVRGAAYTIRTQRNTWIELAAAATVVIAGLWLRIEPLAWAVLAVTIATILALEAFNSAIEAVVDLASPDYHEFARTAKDCAAGALIFAVLGSLGVAAAVFGPPIAQLLGN
jgi:diacylglycerol kinase (ATP)